MAAASGLRVFSVRVAVASISARHRFIDAFEGFTERIDREVIGQVNAVGQLRRRVRFRPVTPGDAVAIRFGVLDHEHEAV